MTGFPGNAEGFGVWEEWWQSLTPEEQARELALMDAHVADVERRRQEGEPE